MIAVAFALLLNAAPASGPSIIIVDPELSTDEASAKYQSDCGGARAQTLPCKHLQWQLEYALWLDLESLSDAGQPIDDDELDVGAAADCPQLKSFALDQLYHRGRLSDAEGKLVIAALNDPYSMVRESASLLVGQVKDGKWTRALQRRGKQTASAQSRFPMPDVQPTDKDLGVTIYAAASYQFFASDDDRAFFNTADSPDKVIAWYAAKGKKAISGAEYQQRIEAGKQAAQSSMRNSAMQDPNAMMKVMQQAMAQGKDPQQAMMEYTQQMQKPLMALDSQWTEDLSHDQGVKDPRYVVIDESTIGGVSVPSHVVMVFGDDILGGTSVVAHRAPPAATMPTQAQIQYQNKVMQQISNDSDAQQIWNGSEGSEP